MKIQPPFRFDGHGINDKNGTRITKVSCLEPYDGNIRNKEFDSLSILFASAPELLDALQIADRRIEQLCNMVNTLARFRKVRVDDFAEEVRAAISKATD